MITLTSFEEARNAPYYARRSAARWAPSYAATWAQVKWMKPLRPDGSAIRLSDFGDDPLPKYREYMISLYRDRWDQIYEWVELMRDRNLWVACWCPFTRTAERQLELFGTFHCHLGVVGEVLTACEVPWQYGPLHEEKMVRTGVLQ